MYTKSAAYYDAIYSFKNYKKESERLTEIIQEHLRSDGRTLLDVACGTGKHIQYLKDNFVVEGVDIEGAFLQIVRERYPDLVFHQGDMRDFALGKKFDVVMCLFSSIGYMQTIADLNQAVANMASHLVPGGLLIIEPWFTTEVWNPNTTHMSTVDEPELKIARVVTSLTEGRLAVMDMHHLIGTPEKTEHFVERHEMLLATYDEVSAAFRHAGLDVYHDPEGLTHRGLFLGINNAESQL